MENGKTLDRILDEQISIRSDIKGLIREVGKANASLTLQTLQTKQMNNYIASCEKRLTDSEIWRAKHEGNVEGKQKLFDIAGVKLTLFCTIGTFIGSIVAFYYTMIKPLIDKIK
jgi:hypothetical protein